MTNREKFQAFIDEMLAHDPRLTVQVVASRALMEWFDKTPVATPYDYELPTMEELKENELMLKKMENDLATRGINEALRSIRVRNPLDKSK